MNSACMGLPTKLQSFPSTPLFRHMYAEYIKERLNITDFPYPVFQFVMTCRAFSRDLKRLGAKHSSSWHLTSSHQEASSSASLTTRHRGDRGLQIDHG